VGTYPKKLNLQKKISISSAHVLIYILLDSMLLCYCDHELPPSNVREDGVCFASHPMNENSKIAARKLQIIAGRLPSQLRQVIKNCQNYSGNGEGRGLKFIGGSTHSTKLANLPFDPTSYLKYLLHERNPHPHFT
jgi:hypothetical protein